MMLKNDEIINLLMVEIVTPSPDVQHQNPGLNEAIRNKIYEAFKAKEPWEKVFECITDDNIRNKYIELFNKLSEKDDTELYNKSISNNRGYAAMQGV